MVMNKKFIFVQNLKEFISECQEIKGLMVNWPSVARNTQREPLASFVYSLTAFSDYLLTLMLSFQRNRHDRRASE